jgi:hypothetical protein
LISSGANPMNPDASERGRPPIGRASALATKSISSAVPRAIDTACAAPFITLGDTL